MAKKHNLNEEYLNSLSEEERNAQQLYNYIGVANKFKKMSLNIYFFLKNYAFNKAMNIKLSPNFFIIIITNS